MIEIFCSLFFKRKKNKCKEIPVPLEKICRSVYDGRFVLHIDLTDRERKHAASQAFSDVTEKIYDNQEGEYPSPYVAAVP